MHRSHSISAIAIALAAALFAVASVGPAFGQGKDVVLASQGNAKVTAADYEASILRIPERDRFGWAMSQERVNKEVEGLLRTRIIADEAKRLGLDADPSIKARVRHYEERLLAEAFGARIDAETTKEFDTRTQVYTERAREQYLTNKSQYQTPAEVKASHILIRPGSQAPEEVLAKARALRAKILAGEPFEAVAVSSSEDPTAKQNKGELGFFSAGQMDPVFEAAAFALTRNGEISEPVRTKFGYHLIRLEDKKPARQLSFEEVAPDLMDKLKSQLLDTRRTFVTNKLFDANRIEWNEPALGQLKKTVDPALLKSVTK
jgi:peptidyl-prolyl cis-trans isomerase C